MQRFQASDFIRQRGTNKQPDPPRDLIAQSAPRAVQITWGLPPGNPTDITGWKIYSPDENTLVATIGDRGTRQYLVPSTSGSTPPTVNIFVSSINALGIESAKVLIQGKATAEAGAPSQPATPPGFTSGAGSDTSSLVGTIDVSTQPGPISRQ